MVTDITGVGELLRQKQAGVRAALSTGVVVAALGGRVIQVCCPVMNG